jgi:hypothetical protein
MLGPQNVKFLYTIPFVYGKFHLGTGHKSPQWKQNYSSTLSLTSALHVGGWSMPCPGHFTPRKEAQYPMYRRLGGPQGQSGWVQKIPPGFKPRTVQTMMISYPGPLLCMVHTKFVYMKKILHFFVSKLQVKYTYTCCNSTF